jgi:hypothetical protein
VDDDEAMTCCGGQSRGGRVGVGKATTAVAQ